MPISEYLWWLGLYLGCKVCTIKINHFWQLLVGYWAILKLIPKLQAFPFSSMPRVDPRVRKSNKSKFAVLLYLLLRWRLHARKAHVWFRKALCWFFIVFPDFYLFLQKNRSLQKEINYSLLFLHYIKKKIWNDLLLTSDFINVIRSTSPLTIYIII